MKKEWNNPVLEVLDVNRTMLGNGGDYTDAAFDPKTHKDLITFS
ncbi:paeninodin family lasso peptide [Oceanobacillus chungangensis]|nr:paeninodin family lasso peptide [Oceanobacillus chungangensis]